MLLARSELISELAGSSKDKSSRLVLAISFHLLLARYGQPVFLVLLQIVHVESASQACLVKFLANGIVWRVPTSHLDELGILRLMVS